MKDKVLILNPGSTSTKIAVYCNDEIIHLESIQHSHEDLAPLCPCAGPEGIPPGKDIKCS